MPYDIFRHPTAALADLVFPPRCHLCLSLANGQDEFFCEPCDQALSKERGTPSCPLCADSVATHEVSGGHCGRCRRRRFRILGSVRVGAYGDSLGALVRRFKYDGREELCPAFSHWLSEAIEGVAWRARIEAVVPVPTHWRHRMGRPLHAAQLLAKSVARELQLPYVPLLRRIRGGPHQVGLPYETRLRNVRGAFSLARGVAMRDATILVIDDVRTTGATLEECAKILLEGGAAEVYAATLMKVSFKSASRGGHLAV